MNKIATFVFLASFSGLSQALDLIVSPDDTGDFTTIQAAVTAVANLPDTTPKFDTTGQTACFFGSGNGLSNNVFGTNTTWLQDIDEGDLIALRGTDLWYEVSKVLHNNGLKIVRPDESATSVCGDYDVVEMNTITIKPGNYIEAVDMSDVHFLHIVGASVRESVVITSSDLDIWTHADMDTFEGYPDYFHHVYENVTVNNLEAGGVFELSPNTTGKNTSLSIKNSIITTYCCDTIYGYGKLGHLEIVDSIFTGGGDIVATGIRGEDEPMKTALIKNSTISSSVSSYGLPERLFGSAVSLSVDIGATIEDSKIICAGINSANACLILDRPSQDPILIKDTIVSSISTGNRNTTAIIAEFGANVILDNVHIESEENGGIDIKVDAGSTVTALCTSYDPSAVTNNGVFTDSGCSQP